MRIKNQLTTLDLETTGIWIEKDRIIEIALIQYDPSGEKRVYHKLVNPGIPIPPKITELTGISDDNVASAPRFKDIATEVYEFIGDSDLAGFNLERFDLPLLERELLECGIVFKWRRHTVYDAQKVFHLNEKRDLSAAYKFYCGKNLENAHTALADTEATYEILCSQVEKYGQGSDDLESLKQFEYQSNTDFYDKDRKLCWRNDKLYLMFGKYAKKKSVEELVDVDKPYLKWILNADFNDQVKGIVQDALDGKALPVRGA